MHVAGNINVCSIHLCVMLYVLFIFAFQKVDIYSLGVIFFEMCHKPFATEMERIQILSDLRMYDCILPKDFLKSADPAQTHIIK